MVPAPTPPADTLNRAINAIVVVAAMGIAAYIYNVALANKDATLFGAFTTFVGTVIAAYFGITATTQVSRTAVDGANQRVADAHQQLGAVQQKLSAVADFAASADPADPNHMQALRKLL
jgi:hypothetical protein